MYYLTYGTYFSCQLWPEIWMHWNIIIIVFSLVLNFWSFKKLTHIIYCWNHNKHNVCSSQWQILQPVTEKIQLVPLKVNHKKYFNSQCVCWTSAFDWDVGVLLHISLCLPTHLSITSKLDWLAKFQQSISTRLALHQYHRHSQESHVYHLRYLQRSRQILTKSFN